MRLLIAIILLLVAFTLAFLFANQNDQVIQLNYLFGETSIDLILLITLCLLIGLLVGILLISGTLVKTRVQLRLARKKLIKVEKELTNLRTLPVKDDM